MRKNYLPILLACSLSVNLAAQQARVVVSNHPDGDRLQIKYYTQSLYFDDGMNIYRREQGRPSWERLNAAPLRKGALRPSQQEFDHDNDLTMFTNTLDSASRDQISGFLLLTCLVKSFQSEPFARYLGILYEDRTVQNGVTYEYQIRRATRAEDAAGTSSPITAGSFVGMEPPQEIKVNNVKEVARFYWLPEPDRYFGVNVYRQENDGAKERITKHPVMVSKVSNEQGERGYGEILFEDASLQEGNTYRYELVAVDFFGRESRRSEPFTIEMKDITPPPPPERLQGEADHVELRAQLKWRAAAARDLMGYFVYRSNTSEGEYSRVSGLLAPATTEFTDLRQRVGTYYYYVTSTDRAGNEAASNKVFVELKDVIPPAAPVNVTVAADTGKVVISWSASPEADLMGYQVYRTVNADRKEKFVLLNATAVTATAYEDELPKNVRNKFLYKVAALDSSHNRSPFSALAATRLPDVTAPAKPFIKKVSPNGNGLVVEWMPLTDRDVMRISLFRITGVEQETIAVLNAGDVSYEDRRVLGGIQYGYFLTATDSAGNLSESSNVFSAGLIGTKSVEVINEVKTDYDSLSKEVTLTWTDVGEKRRGFVVYRSEDQDEFRPVTGIIQNNEFVDGSVSRGRLYAYRIKAFDDTGVKAESEPHEIIIE